MPEFAGGAHRPGALALVLLLVLVEFLWQRLRGVEAYDWRESATSTAIMAGQGLARAGTALLVSPLLQAVYRHRLLDIPLRSGISLLGLFLLVEFVYYWFHRASHRVRWLWATHRVHHSSRRLNFTAAYRLGWTNLISGGWLLFAPLVWLGYAPAAVFGMLAVNLGYQFFLHTELIGRLGPLERVLNTPSQHRVHHCAEPALLDRNFGGVLIVFDRLFGTQADEPRGRRLRYGLAESSGPDDGPRYNPFAVALGGWQALLAELRRAPGLAGKLRMVLGPP